MNEDYKLTFESAGKKAIIKVHGINDLMQIITEKGLLLFQMQHDSNTLKECEQKQ